jgi:four helix bundle protein
MRPHEKLDVYVMAHTVAVRIHRISLQLPKFELYEEGSQVRRSSKSASSQIVEGHALRSYKADYVRYLWRAYGSAEETGEHLRFLIDTNSACDVRAEVASLIESNDELCRRLYNYVCAVERQHEPNRPDPESF